MTEYTVASPPPVQTETSQRRSRWVDLLDECRKHPGEWRRVIEPMRKSTAAQIASDIRNIHRRDARKSRLRGFAEGDKFEAVWGNDPNDSDTDHYYLWLRFDGNDAD